MTPADIKAARLRLGMTQAQLAAALELGKDGRRIVRAWEKGEYQPSGPARVALRFMLERREALEEVYRRVERMMPPRQLPPSEDEIWHTARFTALQHIRGVS